MDTGKINQIIDQKNERLEREALGNAEDIISQIAQKQERIVSLENDIADLRKQLKELTIPQLNPSAILGE